MRFAVLFPIFFCLFAPLVSTGQKSSSSRKGNGIPSKKIAQSEGVISNSAVVGIGPFKIGVTTVDSLASKLGEAIQIDTTFLLVNASPLSQELFEKRPRYTSQGFYKPTRDFELGQFVEGYRIFNMRYYTLEDLHFTDIRMIFFNDTLIHFASSNAPKLDEVLEYKYGKAKFILDKDTVTCVNKLTGAQTEYESFHAFHIWENSDRAIQTYVIKEYNEKCEEKASAGFIMQDKHKEDEYRNKVTANLKAIREEKLKKY